MNTQTTEETTTPAQFTPGPWHLQPTGDGANIVTHRYDMIASVTTEADARLLVHAPDLLEALQYLLDNSPRPKNIRKEFSAFNARANAGNAIYKATGRTQNHA